MKLSGLTLFSVTLLLLTVVCGGSAEPERNIETTVEAADFYTNW